MTQSQCIFGSFYLRFFNCKLLYVFVTILQLHGDPKMLKQWILPGSLAGKETLLVENNHMGQKDQDEYYAENVTLFNFGALIHQFKSRYYQKKINVVHHIVSKSYNLVTKQYWLHQGGPRGPGGQGAQSVGGSKTNNWDPSPQLSWAAPQCTHPYFVTI